MQSRMRSIHFILLFLTLVYGGSTEAKIISPDRIIFVAEASPGSGFKRNTLIAFVSDEPRDEITNWDFQSLKGAFYVFDPESKFWSRYSISDIEFTSRYSRDPDRYLDDTSGPNMALGDTPGALDEAVIANFQKQAAPRVGSVASFRLKTPLNGQRYLHIAFKAPMEMLTRRTVTQKTRWETVTRLSPGSVSGESDMRYDNDGVHAWDELASRVVSAELRPNALVARLYLSNKPNADLAPLVGSGGTSFQDLGHFQFQSIPPSIFKGDRFIGDHYQSKMERAPSQGGWSKGILVKARCQKTIEKTSRRSNRRR